MSSEEPRAPLEPELRDFSEFLQVLNRESDRGAALLAGSMLDEKVLELLNAFLIEGEVARNLLRANGPVGTFAARVDMAYALGLIEEEERVEINLIRRVRNPMGHTWRSIDFSDDRLRDLIAKLPWRGPEDIELTARTPRSRFTFAVVSLLVSLLWRRRLVERERRAPRVWPHKR